MKIYQIDTKYFDIPIDKGKTYVNVILLEDFNRILRENNIVFLNKEHMQIKRLSTNNEA